MKRINFPLIFRVTEALKTATLKDTGVVFIGNFISSILGAIFFFLLAHQGGPYVLGVFGVSIAIAITVVDLFDVAIDNAVVNFGSRPEARGAVLRSSLRRKIGLSVFAAFLLWVFAPALVLFFEKPDILQWVRAAAWLIPAKSLFNFVKTVFQISRKFHFDAGIEIFSSLIRLAVFMLVFVTQIQLLPLAFLAYIGALFLPVVIALPFVIPFLREKSRSETHRRFTSYQLWMTLSFAASSLSSRLDIFFLTRLTSLEIVGWYQAAFRLFMPIQQLAGSLTRVFAPRLANFGQSVKAQQYLKKSVLLAGLLSLSILIPIPIFPLVIPFLYGGRFHEAVPIAYGLIPYFMIFLFSTPWWSVLLYFHSKARTFAALSIIGLFLQLGLFPLAIFLLGVHGAAVSLFVSHLMLIILVVRKSKI